MATEGNLAAPTRHAIDWQNPDYYNEEATFHEMERIFDICHGCRRCVSLCGSFPTLFDLVDESKTMEVDGVDKKDYWKVVDQCYMCDLCYLTKCPYVPPHEFNLDFPHTMLRAKAIKFKKGEVGMGEKILSSTDVTGSFAGIPIVSQLVNAVNKTKPARAVMEKVLGVDKDAWLPEFAAKKFRSGAATSKEHSVVDGAKTPGKVAIYATCYINYNEPGIGHDLLKILDHNAVPYVIVEKESCCGMPKLELGDLDSVGKSKDANIPTLAKYAKDGFAILQEIEAYAPLVPDGCNWKATMLIEYPDENERRRELARLIGVADHMFVEVEGHTRVYAIADEDLERENDEKTSAVHFVRFELNAAMRAAVLAGAGVKLGCDHTNYPAHTQIEPEALTSLASDLKL